MKRSLLWSVFLPLFLLLSGCASAPSPTRAYDGNTLRSEEVARIRPHSYLTTVWDVDDRNIFFINDQRLLTTFIEVLPGKRKISLRYERGVGVVGAFFHSRLALKDVVLDAVAGHTYIPRTEIVGDQARFWLEDGGTDYDQRCPNRPPNITILTNPSAMQSGC